MNNQICLKRPTHRTPVTTLRQVLGAVALAAVVLPGAVHAQASEIILDNGSAAFSTTGTWPASDAYPGYIGANYQYHGENGTPATEIIADNGDANFGMTGTWGTSSNIAGYWGSNYFFHPGNGALPAPTVVDDPAGTAQGSWTASSGVAGYIGTGYRHHAAGTGANHFTWTLSVPATGVYQIYARWTSHTNRATNAKYVVAHANGQTTATVNQQTSGGTWVPIGTYTFLAGTATVRLSDNANGYVVADAIQVQPVNAAAWTLQIPSAESYRVYARWISHSNRATNAKYDINHASGQATVSVNQQQAGGTWNLLGTYNFNAGPAIITLTDRANGYVVADAVRLVPVDGGATNTATWTPNVPQAGQYEVFARWTTHVNRATDAKYTIVHANGQDVVTVNQEQSGGVWNSLGVYSFAPGYVHRITLSDQANGDVIADAIRLAPPGQQPPTQSGNIYYIHPDHLNTPRLINDQTQKIVWRWDQQEPFGDTPPHQDPDGDQIAFVFPLRFPGQYYDQETGLAYNYHRDYNSTTGRYVQSDPIGLRAGLNLYTYVDGSPLTHIDLFGLAKLNLFDPNSQFFSFAANDPDIEGVLTVYAHGSSSAKGKRLWDESCGKDKCSKKIDVDQLIGLIVQSGRWRAGMPIRIVSCWGARGSDSIAAELAKKLNTSVTGNAGLVTLISNGVDGAWEETLFGLPNFASPSPWVTYPCNCQVSDQAGRN